ncbi:MAG: hypothetical protein V4463_05235 [Pseudomonadota bacterium]
MLKRIILVSALFLASALAFGQASGPIYNSANVNITGGAIGSSKIVKCRGSADDVTINAVASALSAAGRGKVILNGDCDITSAILFYSGVVYECAGPTKLTLHANTAYSDLANVFFGKASNSADLDDFGIQGRCIIDGNRDNQLNATLYGRAVGSVALSSIIPLTVSGSNNTLTYTLDGVSKTATIASATYSTVQTLVSAIDTATQAASANSYARQFGGFLVILSGTADSTGSIASVAGNAAATLVGTPTYISASTDNAYNGIVIRGSSNKLYKAKNFFVDGPELKNAGYHGIAVYDGATQGRLENGDWHHNGFRCGHVHASSGASDQPTTRFIVAKNKCHEDGQAVVLPNTSGTGLFVFFDGTRDASVKDNLVWGEPDVGFDVSGSTSGSVQPTDNVVIGGNIVTDSGTGYSMQPGTSAPLTGVTFSGNSARDISYPFILGSAAATLTITTGSNDMLAVTLAGVTHNVVIPAGAPYASAAALASAIQTAVNTAFAADGSALTVSAPAAPSGYIYAVPVFTNGRINNSFSIAAPGSQSAYATVFGSSPTQYGNRRTTASGGCLNIVGNASYAWSNISVTGFRANNCAAWGASITGGGSSVLATRLSYTGGGIDSAGLDHTVNTGGVHFKWINGFTFNGVDVTGNNTKATAGRQVYLNSNTTLGALGANYIDTIVTSGASTALDIATTANYNAISGNVFNRNDGTGNQINDTGTGNVIGPNVYGKTGAGSFLRTGTAPLFNTGAANLTVPFGGLGIAKITADGAAPGAGGGKLQFVCGTNAGTAKLVISAGTSATAVTVVDNIGAGVTGC